MQREKPYNLQKTAYFNCLLIVSKKEKFCATVPKKVIFSIRRDISFLLSQIWNKPFFKNCRAFYATSCGIVCFSIKSIKELKTEIQKLPSVATQSASRISEVVHKNSSHWNFTIMI